MSTPPGDGRERTLLQVRALIRIPCFGLEAGRTASSPHTTGANSRFGLEAGRTASSPHTTGANSLLWARGWSHRFLPSHHGSSRSRADFGALTRATRVRLCFLPSPGP
uniref:Uncharacterized protein n=1 Tax=Rangifer tarandus platyrhynchus TaxID=3082113 RepID=A0ACB0EYW2_RANTA|nr:unnamed protein product [Rangifer tarandus platyrhynchus]